MGITHSTEDSMKKVMVDFSFAAAMALGIGLAVGGTAFSFVWLVQVLGA
jgi:hypothetical protein